MKSFPAPVGGWVANENLAAPGGRKPDGSRVYGAAMLDNGFPTATGVRMRSGSEKHATVGSGDPVETMFSYLNGNAQDLFAATETDIYDITTIADPDVSPSAAVSSLTSGDWSVVQFATAGGVFLRLVNGADTPRVYDGTNWGTSPAITGTGLTAANLSFVWSHNKRLFFVEKETLNAWYLPVDSIGGVAQKLPLGGVFKRGGQLLFGASWSLDENAGLSATCVFVTTEGEAAIYKGSNPASSESWQLVGVYRIGRPLGSKAWLQAGGDLIIATDIGMIPLSEAIRKDFAALGLAAVSFPIEDAWNKLVASRIGSWQCEMWPTKQMVIVAPPPTDELECLVVNVRTGAWARYTGWDVQCLELFSDRMFFGTPEGVVIEAEVSGSDMGASYSFACVPQFDDLRSPLSNKIGLLGRAVYLAPERINDQMSLQVNYSIDLPSAPDDVESGSANLWGSGVWGTSVWGVDPELLSFSEWRSLPGEGAAIAPAIQITSGRVPPPAVELVRMDITYENAEIVA